MTMTMTMKSMKMTFRKHQLTVGAATFALALASWLLPIPATGAANRFHVIACSEPASEENSARKAGRAVRALRRAGFPRAHLIRSNAFPKLSPDFLICVVDSMPSKKRAFDVAAFAKNKGFPAYVAVGW